MITDDDDDDDNDDNNKNDEEYDDSIQGCIVHFHLSIYISI